MTRTIRVLTSAGAHAVTITLTSDAGRRHIQVDSGDSPTATCHFLGGVIEQLLADAGVLGDTDVQLRSNIVQQVGN